MKKVLKFLLWTLGVIIILVLGFIAFVSFRGIPKYKAEKLEMKIESTPERLAQGYKLSALLCKGCHYNNETKKFTGRQMLEAPQFGEIYTKNITRHKTNGIGSWTDGELYYLLRTGLKSDGTYLPPYMPKLANISDEDLNSIIVFLKSDHEWVQPNDTVMPLTKPSLLTKILTNLKVFKPFPLPTQPILNPDTSNTLAIGKYIALYQLECFSCHSKDFAKNDFYNPEKSPGFFGGGNEMFDEQGKARISLNITMDEETGIGKWTEEQFVAAVKYGQVPNNRPALRNPMLPYALLTDAEVKAIFTYLKTVSKIKNKVERSL